MKFRSLGVAAAGMALLAVSAFAQITTIEGVAKDPTGKPIEKAEVQIIRTDIKGNYKTKTDKKGHYLYMGLPMGTYTVDLYVDGKKVDSVAKVQTRPGDPIPVNFDLKATQQDQAAKNAEMQKAVETGQISKEMERQMSPEQKAAMEKQIKERQATMAKNKELNDTYNAGMDAMTQKNYPAAIEALNKASQIDPSQVAIWSQLGEAHMQFAKTKTGPEYDAEVGQALQAYQKSIELKPDDAGAHNNYALALGQAKKFDEMQAELKKAIELQPTYADAYYQYAVALSAKMTLDKDGKPVAPAGMAEALNKYLELAPNGRDAEAAKALLAGINASVDTKYVDPNAKKNTPAKKKK